MQSENITNNVPAGYSRSTKISENQNQPFIPGDEISENVNTEDSISSHLTNQYDIEDIKNYFNCDYNCDSEHLDIS